MLVWLTLSVAALGTLLVVVYVAAIGWQLLRARWNLIRLARSLEQVAARLEPVEGRVEEIRRAFQGLPAELETLRRETDAAGS